MLCHLQDLFVERTIVLDDDGGGRGCTQLVCIGKDIQIGSGATATSLDALCVSPSGQIVVVRAPNSSETSHLVDLLAKTIVNWDCDYLDSVAADYYYSLTGQAVTCFDLMLSAGYLKVSDFARYTNAVSSNLLGASFLLLHESGSLG